MLYNSFILKTQISSKALNFLIFAAIAFVAYWQVAFLYNSLKWDMLDCHLPWNGFVEDCISNKLFPYWCPYQFFGYPIHANLFSVLNPEFWISGIFRNSYSIYNLHFFLLLYIIIAGYGMYRLTSYLGCDSKSSVVSGITYMLCGYIVSQGQEMSNFAGMAWLPFTILYYIRMNGSFSIQDTLKASVFLFLMISMAFPGVTIILNYLFFAVFLALITKAFISKDYRKIRKHIYFNILLYFIVLLMCSFYFTGLYYSINYVERFSGLSVEKVSSIPFTPQSLLSLVFPFASVKSEDFFKTNLTMNNIYIGIFFYYFF